MSWRSQSAKWADPWYYDNSRPKSWKGDGKTKKDQGKALYGYDGKRLDLPPSSLPSSSTSASGAKDSQLDVKSLLAEVLKHKDKLDPAILQRLVESEEKEKMKEEQRQLNLRRKMHRKQESIQKQLAEKESAFANWKAGLKEVIRMETIRHQDSMEKLNAELARVQKAIKEGEEEYLDERMEAKSSSEDEEQQSLPESRSMRELRARLEQSDGQCRQLLAANSALNQKLDHVLGAFNIAPTGPETVIENHIPYVTSPSHGGTIHIGTGRRAMTPFGKSPKEPKARVEPYNDHPPDKEVQVVDAEGAPPDPGKGLGGVTELE